ncbi:MAG: hypothetical protein FJ303_22550 [Planctomycetes bacterium]|nr:hypothetical protein [Planctomycetota bacterium]
MLTNPLAHLSGGNVELDRRRNRRILDEAELRMIMASAASSKVVFHGLTGYDRELLYLVACVTGFRAGELAVLCPKDFNLDCNTPEVALSATFAKNKKAAVQPLPLDVADTLRPYLLGKASDVPVWGGTWYECGADMLRIDLDAAGIPYVVQGPDGPIFTDFHALRHSFVFLCDKAGLSLKTAMSLARHSDPKLTMKVYGRPRPSDLSNAIERLPSLTRDPVPKGTPIELAATGTDGAVEKRLPFSCLPDETIGDPEGQSGMKSTPRIGGEAVLEEIDQKQLATRKDGQGLDGTSASCRARTYDPLIKRRA